MGQHPWSTFVTATGDTVWSTTLENGEERSYSFRTLILPGPPSSSHQGAKTSTPILCLVNTNHLDSLLASSLAAEGRITGLLRQLHDDEQLYELRKTNTKGWALFARRSIEEGQLIAWEHPAIILPSTEREFTREIYKQLVSPEDANVHAIWQKRRLEAMQMANEYGGEDGCTTWVEGVARTNGSVLEFIEDSKATRSKKSTFDSQKIVQKEVYGGIYPLLNRANHSCAPNAAVKWDKTTFSASLHALCDIEEGEEICKTYVNPLLPHATRLAILQKNYRFKCDCSHCNLPETLAAESDANRELLATWIFTQPTYKKWSSDLCRPDSLFIESHLEALRLIEEEGVFALRGIFMEELAMAYATLGDLTHFKLWGERVRRFSRVEDPELSRRFRDWLQDPERKVKRWGWRKRMREEAARLSMKRSEEIDIGLLFEPIDSD